MAPECVDIRMRLHPIGPYRLQRTACRKSGPERNGKSELRVDTVGLWRCGTAKQDATFNMRWHIGPPASFSVRYR
eukprot:scaffold41152_cov65-Phaeocystis_antarctica.AAC.7